jgi:hypothetical protein
MPACGRGQDVRMAGSGASLNLRAGAIPKLGARTAARQILHGLKAVQDDVRYAKQVNSGDL